MVELLASRPSYITPYRHHEHSGGPLYWWIGALLVAFLLFCFVYGRIAARRDRQKAASEQPSPEQQKVDERQ